LTFNLFYAMIVNDMELLRSTSYRGFSVRSMLVFALTVIMTALLWVTVVAPGTTHAASDATWNGDSIMYDGHQYIDAGEAKAGESHGLAVGSHYYVYTPAAVQGSTTQQKAFIIYFSPGVDPPVSDNTATYTEYTLSTAGQFSQPANTRTISIEARGTSDNVSTSCAIQGVGWIVCSISVFLAQGMDWVFTQLKGFVEVQPPKVGDTSADLYVAWNIMRTIANIAFIIVFLIIIYSQLTSLGVSNYGLKRLLPRLVIAAVLVNVSYFICAIAIDISNILGYSVQDIFVSIREGAFNIDNDTWSADTLSWESVTGFILSGGTITLAAGLGAGGALLATGGDVVGLIFLVLPALLGLILAVLVVLLILAARQAIIILLLIVAPLAFVAYLLPNTEKLFNKWRDLFMTMLVFFPALSLVFGGAQLAGGLIIQNANSINVMILGMIVQVAPLVITPLLLKLSGSLLGRIAGLVNDPKRGLMDRTKNWTNARVEDRKFKKIGGPVKKYDLAGRAARRLEYRNGRLKRSTEAGKAGFEAYSAVQDTTSKRGQQIETNMALSKMAAEESRHEMDQAIQEMRAGDASGLQRLRMHADVTMTERVRARVGNTTVDQIRTKRYDLPQDADGNYLEPKTAFGKYAVEATQRAQHLDQSSRVIAGATASAQAIQLQKFATAMEGDETLQVLAGGIDRERGAQRALANAIAAQSKAHGEAVSNAASILTRFNYGDDVVTDIALDRAYKHPQVTFKITDEVREAAIAKIAGGANATEILRLTEELEINTSDDNTDFRQTFADTIIANGNKPKFAGAGIIGAAKQGNIPAPGPGRINAFVTASINDDKFGAADVLVTQDKSYLEAVLRTLKDQPSVANMNTDALETLRESIADARSNPLYKGRVGERKRVLQEMQAELDKYLPPLPPTPPTTPQP